jgi:hypothetical protein
MPEDGILEACKQVEGKRVALIRGRERSPADPGFQLRRFLPIQ